MRVCSQSAAAQNSIRKSGRVELISWVQKGEYLPESLPMNFSALFRLSKRLRFAILQQLNLPLLHPPKSTPSVSLLPGIELLFSNIIIYCLSPFVNNTTVYTECKHKFTHTQSMNNK